MAPDGFGKTSIVTVVAQRLRREGCSCYYVPCYGFETLEAMAQQLLIMLDQPSYPREAEAEAEKGKVNTVTNVRQLCHYINTISQDTLFILDGVDNLVNDELKVLTGDCLAILDQVQRNKFLKVLCTSEKLTCFPNGYDVVTLKFGPLSTDDANNLIKQYLPEIQRRETEVIGKLCDFMPLALHILSATLREDGTTPAELDAALLSADEVRHRQQDPDPILFQAVDYSFQRLSQEDQRLFAYLSVFGNHFTAEDLARMSGDEDATVKTVLERFRRRCLVDYDIISNKYFQHHLLWSFSFHIRTTRDDINIGGHPANISHLTAKHWKYATNEGAFGICRLTKVK